MEHTLSDLQAQIDRLSLTLVQWRETQDHLLPMEQRLSQLAERCADILNHWADTDHRHALAVTEVEARLSEWGAIEGRLERDAADRIRELERTIEHEWKTLRDLHEAPANHLREQAAALGETCVAAANLALRGFERSEARFAALEASLQGRLTQLSSELQAGLAELKRGTAPLGAPVAPFPLDEVMRIHDDLREKPPAVREDALAIAPRAAALDRPSSLEMPGTSAAFSDRMASLEREVTTGKHEARDTATRTAHLRRDWRLTIGAFVVGIVAVVLFGLSLQRRLDDASTRVATAEAEMGTVADTANRQIASARADADRQMAAAHDAASKAEIVSNVLAANDLVRFNLTGSGAAASARAQVLWSRSAGLVLSASDLPPVAAGATYQVWLTTQDAAVSAALATPESNGRVSLAVENPPNLPRPVTGVMVTSEPTGGRSEPSGAAVLVRSVP